ncbi:MAG: tRNA uridine-5-carboxymethylaminomethyl(34) synthesis GTPase MnmE, partial [Trichococcus flocculiformis]
TEEDKQLLEDTKDMNRIILMNKMDLEAKMTTGDLEPWSDPERIIETSMLSETGLDQLENQITKMFFSGETGERDATYVSNVRHIALLNDAMDSLDEVLSGIASGMPIDLVQIDFTRCWDLLGEITGDSVQDELLTQLFTQFCLGK